VCNEVTPDILFGLLYLAVRPPSVRGRQWLFSAMQTRNWSHSPLAWIIHYSHREFSLRWTLFFLWKCPVLSALFKVWGSCFGRHCFTALLYFFFDNAHLLLLFCALLMTKWGNELWKMIINAAGLLTREEHFFSSALKKRNVHSSKIHCILYSSHATIV